MLIELTGDCDDDLKQAIAGKIIALAKAGERNPDLLCERVLEEIRGPRGGTLGTNRVRPWSTAPSHAAGNR
jgi:hypothetical protein